MRISCNKEAFYVTSTSLEKKESKDDVEKESASSLSKDDICNMSIIGQCNLDFLWFLINSFAGKLENNKLCLSELRGGGWSCEDNLRRSMGSGLVRKECYRLGVC